MSCNGLSEKQSAKGEKCFDLILHFFEFGLREALTCHQKISLKTKMFFIAKCDLTYGETAFATMDALMQQYGIDLHHLTIRFTFVTDCAISMPNITGVRVTA